MLVSSSGEKYSFGTTHYFCESDVVMFSNFIINNIMDVFSH